MKKFKKSIILAKINICSKWLTHVTNHKNWNSRTVIKFYSKRLTLYSLVKIKLSFLQLMAKMYICFLTFKISHLQTAFGLRRSWPQKYAVRMATSILLLSSIILCPLTSLDKSRQVWLPPNNHTFKIVADDFKLDLFTGQLSM